MEKRDHLLKGKIEMSGTAIAVFAYLLYAGFLALCIGFTLFCIAWITVLPTIGLLYWIGYLQ